jgi:hypothetical protein
VIGYRRLNSSIAQSDHPIAKWLNSIADSPNCSIQSAIANRRSHDYHPSDRLDRPSKSRNDWPPNSSSALT